MAKIDYKGGLVSSPKWVGWVRLTRGWEANCSSDDVSEVKRVLLYRHGLSTPTCVLPMGQRPVEATKKW